MVSVRQNEISAQQNAVVKQLTLVATVFLPLTFVAGIGGLVVSCIALYAWFRRGGYATEVR